MPMLEIEVYDGAGTRVYWEENSTANIYIRNNVICINGNKDFFVSLAKQMLYFANNDYCLPHGTHVHYDQTFERNYTGLEMILEVIPANHQGVPLDVDDSLYINVNLPDSTNRLYACWNDRSKIVVSASRDVHILADYHGLVFMATVLLFLVETDTRIRAYLCDKQHFRGWSGYNVMFELVS